MIWYDVRHNTKKKKKTAAAAFKKVKNCVKKAYTCHKILLPRTRNWLKNLVTNL